MVLQTERLSIRYVTENDWQRVKSIWEDFNSSPYAQYDMKHDTDEAYVRAMMARWEKANGGREHLFFAVCLSDILIGYVVFHMRDAGYELGYCFHSDHHGKGYAKESLAALLNYLQSLGTTAFFAGTAIQNRPSVNLLSFLGFKQVGKETVSFYKDSDGNDIVFDGGIFELIV